MKLRNLKSLALLAMAAVSSSLLATPHANAGIIAIAAEGGGSDTLAITLSFPDDHNWDEMGLGEHVERVVVCALILPLCLLDQKVDGVRAMTEQDLIDNTGSKVIADSLIAQNHELADRLAQKGEKLVVTDADTAQTVSNEILNVMPSATPKFVNFYVSQILTQ